MRASNQLIQQQTRFPLRFMAVKRASDVFIHGLYRLYSASHIFVSHFTIFFASHSHKCEIFLFVSPFVLKPFVYVCKTICPRAKSHLFYKNMQRSTTKNVYDTKKSFSLLCRLVESSNNVDVLKFNSKERDLGFDTILIYCVWTFLNDT